MTCALGVLGSGVARAESVFEGGLGIGGIRTGGTSFALGAGAGTHIRPNLVLGARAFAMRSAAIDLAYRPEAVTAGFGGPSVTLVGDVGFIGAALGVTVFDTDRARELRVGVALRAGAILHVGRHVIAFSIDTVTPIQSSPVPWIAFVVGYLR